MKHQYNFTWIFLLEIRPLSFASSSSCRNESPTDRLRQGHVVHPLATGLDRRDAPSEVDDVRADPLQWGWGHHRLLFCSLFSSCQWSRGRLSFHWVFAIRLSPIGRIHCDSIFIVISFHCSLVSIFICTRVDVRSLQCCCRHCFRVDAWLLQCRCRNCFRNRDSRFSKTYTCIYLCGDKRVHSCFH